MQQTDEKIRKIEWSPKWDGGAPTPQVFCNGRSVYLIYTVADWDQGSFDKFEKLSATEGYYEYLVLVKFNGHTFRFGVANDEVFQGLPYYKQGIRWAQVIENSSWVEEIKTIHKVHPYYDESRWTNLNHYLLLFKDQLLEVIASDFKIEVFQTTYQRLGQEVVKRMNEI